MPLPKATSTGTTIVGCLFKDGIILGADEWTPESGLVTAAQKVQRKNVEKAFKAKIDVRCP